MKISRQVSVTFDRTLEEISKNRKEQLRTVLEDYGFRDISLSENNICAYRGSIWATLLIPGDPRRWYHTINITKQEMRFDIDTWFGAFAKADEEVFKVEGNQILDTLCGISVDDCQIKKATVARRYSDVRIVLSLVAIGMVLGAILLTLLLSMRIIT